MKLEGPAWWALLVMVLVLAIAAALSGSGASMPLDGHEVLVARTGEEMIARHDLLVPYINDAPRLKKPPMNYWLAILADRVLDHNGMISEFEARLPSIVAGIGVAMITVLLGAMLFDRVTGVLAGLLVVSCSGYLGYTHSARPEMVYALFCTLGLLGWTASSILIEQEASRNKARLFAWLGWAAMGLAMLTKGPQLPAILLSGFIVYLCWVGRRREIGYVLRPFSGVLIFLAVSLWWYIHVFTTVTDSLAIWQEEAAHRARGNWWGLLDPYYLYRTPGLLLPWVVFFVLGLLAPRGERLRTHRSVKLCWSLLVVGMLALSLALGRRWYYMLPVLAPMAVLMAAAAIDAAGWLLKRRGGRAVLLVVLLGHLTAITVIAVWALKMQSERDAPPQAGVVVIAGVFVVTAAALVLLTRPSRDPSPTGSLMLTAAAMAICLTILQLRDSLGGDTRIPRRDFALEVGQMVPRDEPLIGLGDSWQIEAYYTHRPIRAFKTDEDIGRYIQEKGRAWVLAPDQPGRKLKLDDTQFYVETAITFDCPVASGPPERMVLKRVMARE